MSARLKKSGFDGKRLPRKREELETLYREHCLST